MFFPISWLSTEKPNQTQQKQACIRNKIYRNIQLTQKLKPGLLTTYNLWPKNGMCLFWKK